MNATVRGVIFDANERYGFTTAMERMNSKSRKEFRWSVRLIKGNWIGIGIATSSPPTNDNIRFHDQNAIICHPYSGLVMQEKTTIQSNIINADNGDEIHFRFQPKLKKFSISFVCSSIIT